MPAPGPDIFSDGGPLGGPPIWSLTAVQARYRRRVLDKLRAGTYRLQPVPRCLCGGEKAVTIATQDRFGMPVGVVACRDCGLARTTPRLHADDLPTFYRDDYHGLHMGVPEPHPSMALFRVGQGKRIYELVKSMMGQGTRIADVGCGTGQVMREFQAAAKADGVVVDAIGCEYAPTYVEAGRSAGSVIEEGSADRLEPHGPFDLVIMSHVLEHFADPLNELQTISGLIGAGGHVYVEVPGIRSIHRKPEYDYDLLSYLTLAHTYHFSLESLTDVLARAGFARMVGDEEVCAVFRHGAVNSRDASSGAVALIAYLEWLRSSRVIRFMRLGRRARRIVLAGLRRSLGIEGYEAVRRISRRARIRR